LEQAEEVEPIADEDATSGYQARPQAVADGQAFQATAYQESGPYGPPPGAAPPSPAPPRSYEQAPREPSSPEPAGAPPAPAPAPWPAAPPAPPRATPSTPPPAAPEQAGPRMVIGGVLLSYQDDSYGRHWLLHDGDNLVGRADTAVKVDVPISHGTTSTRHASIHCAEGQVTLTDLKSTNGTFQNGRKLLPNSPAQIASGDKLRFGGFTVHVYFPPSRQQ
jgi:hypothetical protein